eukprot:TRINITY_DN53342_c0_g1_i1.p1 TRINITY_DN53342_c0_g1~~TRINITY_DN53342_c0_g1_i1.p1  ORF type:complete len:108 (-),score=20.78 TRINITY_DN53342_c0_g1_i1:275-598(-)
MDKVEVSVQKQVPPVCTLLAIPPAKEHHQLVPANCCALIHVLSGTGHFEDNTLEKGYTFTRKEPCNEPTPFMIVNIGHTLLQLLVVCGEQHNSENTSKNMETRCRRL